MREYTKFYINGAWVEPSQSQSLDVLDPSTEEVCARISLGNEADVDQAVAAAKAAFETFSQSPVEERVALLERVAEIYKRRISDIAEAIRLEMGAPIKLASTAQAFAGLGHIVEAAKVLKTYAFTGLLFK